MIRAILYLFVAVLLISVLRAVIGVVSKGFADLFGNPSQASGPRTRTPQVPRSEALKKDPVCGTFIAPSAAVVQTIEGEPVYFCSAACRDKYRSEKSEIRE